MIASDMLQTFIFDCSNCAVRSAILQHCYFALHRCNKRLQTFL